MNAVGLVKVCEVRPLTRLTNHKHRYTINRGISKKLRSSGDEHLGANEFVVGPAVGV